MNNNYSIDPSLQKKIYQNDIKFKMLLSKGLFSLNKSTTGEKENENKEENLNLEMSTNNTKEDNNFIKETKKRMKLKENKEKTKNNSNNILHIEEDNKETEKISNSFMNSKENIEQFEEKTNKGKEKLNIPKIEIEKNKKENYNKPKTCNGNEKNNNNEIKDFFLKRQKKLLEKTRKKREKLKSSITKKEVVKNPNTHTHSVHTIKNKTNFKDYYNNFEKWEKERINKIEKMKKEKEEKIKNEFDYKPKIDEKSAKLARKNKLRINQPNTFIRLSEQDKILKEKKQLLKDMYTPSFQPFCYEPLNLNLKNKQKNNFFTENNLEDKEEDKSESCEEKEEGNENEINEKKEDDFDYQQDMMIFTDDNVEDALRGSLFHKKKKSNK